MNLSGVVCRGVYVNILFYVLSLENIFTIPNVLSLGRIVLSPVLGYFVLSENYKLALAFFVLAGVSDMVGTCMGLHKSITGS